MREVDQDIVVLYILVKIFMMFLRAIRVYEGFFGGFWGFLRFYRVSRVFLWFLSFLFEEILISWKLDFTVQIKIRFGISDLDYLGIQYF